LIVGSRRSVSASHVFRDRRQHGTVTFDDNISDELYDEQETDSYLPLNMDIIFEDNDLDVIELAQQLNTNLHTTDWPLFTGKQDLPDVVRSILQSIGLIEICLTKLLSTESNRRSYFEPIVTDLNTLQTSGINVGTFDGRVYFSFTVLAADHLASNEVGGFQRNFSSGYFCRLCYISASHQQKLEQLMQSKDKPILSGVTGESFLAKLVGFHPVNSLPFDLMHDFAEVQRLLNENSIGELIYIECKTISHDHVKIVKESAFVLKLVHEEEIPCFVYIRQILKVKDTWKLLVEHLNTASFNEKLWSYAIDYLDEEVNGEMLSRLPFEEIRIIFPKLKDRMKFTEERDKLIKSINGCENLEQFRLYSLERQPQSQLNDGNNSLSSAGAIFDDEPIPVDNEVTNLQQITTTMLNDNNLLNKYEQEDEARITEKQIPNDYELPVEIQLLVDEKDLTRLNGHTNHCRVLLDFVFEDVKKTHGLL
ncbi:unnamed protein product, partial [Didymodactylos carnosus]